MEKKKIVESMWIKRMTCIWNTFHDIQSVTIESKALEFQLSQKNVAKSLLHKSVFYGDRKPNTERKTLIRGRQAHYALGFDSSVVIVLLRKINLKKTCWGDAAS